VKPRGTERRAKEREDVRGRARADEPHVDEVFVFVQLAADLRRRDPRDIRVVDSMISDDVPLVELALHEVAVRPGVAVLVHVGPVEARFAFELPGGDEEGRVHPLAFRISRSRSSNPRDRHRT